MGNILSDTCKVKVKQIYRKIKENFKKYGKERISTSLKTINKKDFSSLFLVGINQKEEYVNDIKMQKRKVDVKKSYQS